MRALVPLAAAWLLAGCFGNTTLIIGVGDSSAPGGDRATTGGGDSSSAGDGSNNLSGDTASAGGDQATGDVAGGDLVAGDVLLGDAFVGDSYVGDTFVGDTFVGDTFVGDTFVGDQTPLGPALRISSTVIENFDDAYPVLSDGTFLVQADLGGRTPSAVMVIMSTVDGLGSLHGTYSHSVGFFDGTTQIVAGNAYENDQLESDVNRAMADDLVGLAWAPGGTGRRNAVEAIEFVPDGLRLRPDWPSSNDATIVVVFFAGPDITGAHVGAPPSYDVIASDVDVGFQPNLMFFSYNGTSDESTTAFDANFESNTNTNYSFAIDGASGLQQYTLYGRELNGEGVTAGQLRARDAAIAITASSNDIVIDAITATGFSFSAPADGHADQVLPYLALQVAGPLAAGVSETPADVTTDWEQPLTFAPEALFTLGHTKNGAALPFDDSGGNDVISMSLCFGGADGTSFSLYGASEDGIDMVTDPTLGLTTDTEGAIFSAPFRIDQANGGDAFHFDQLEMVDDILFTGWRFRAAGFLQHETTPIHVPWLAIGASR